jgi:alkylation response protein AidB-like acyl-CoA dehydrogenase/aminoglycoside phosphotransferase (APT) family kinase protein
LSDRVIRVPRAFGITGYTRLYQKFLLAQFPPIISMSKLLVSVRDNGAFNYSSLEKYMQKNAQVIRDFFPDSKLTKVSQVGQGQSNPTYILGTADNVQYILRKKPKGKLLPSAHAIDREYLIIGSLKKVDFPVPQVYIYCSDSSVIGEEFYLMEFVEGRIFQNPRLPTLSLEDKREIYASFVKTLAKLHSIKYKDIGLEGYGKPNQYFERQLSTWTRQYKASETHEIPAMENLMKWLNENLPKDDGQSCIVHGDYKMDNIIFHPTENRVLAVLDWELSTIGHPYSDVGYVCMTYHLPGQLLGGDGNFDGIPNKEEVQTLYGTKIPKLNYYIAFSLFRLAAITQGVYKRGLQGNSSQQGTSRFKVITEALAKIGSDLTHNSQESQISFVIPSKIVDLCKKIDTFLDEYVIPHERDYTTHVHQHSTNKPVSQWKVPPIMEEWKKKAKEHGLWNFFLKSQSGLSNVEYGIVCEAMIKKSFLSPEIFNCSAPDTGNMEVLQHFGTKEQKEKWLKPLLNGEVRSCFGMTEPGVASSDATNIECKMVKDGSDYVINGSKWWITGAGDPRCKICILMVKSDPNAHIHKQQSMVLVPMNTRGVKIIRALTVFGTDDAPSGHCELHFDNVRVPQTNILLGEGRGFEIAQERLGPGRIHHCMRMIGSTERCLTEMLNRTEYRVAFGKKLSLHQSIRNDIAESRMEIEQARLLVMKTADMMDRVGNKNARSEIAMIKVVVPRMAQKVIDRAIQAFGAAGLSDDYMLAQAFIGARSLRIADGPDQVHMETVARLELEKFKRSKL